MDFREDSWSERLIQSLAWRPRATILPWFAWAAIFGFFIGVALYPVFARAEEIPAHVFEQDGVSMRLMRTPCVDPSSQMVIVSSVPMKYHAMFKSLQSTWRLKDGSWKDYGGCWLEISKEEFGEDVIVLIFSDGARYVVKKKEFLGEKPEA